MKSALSVNNRIILIFLFSFFSFAAIAQDEEEGPGPEVDNHLDHVMHSPYRLSVRVNTLIPHPVSNGAFRRSFNGVYDLTGSVNLEVFQGFNVGVMYKNALFITPANKIPGLNTKEQYNAAGLRLGYDYYVTRIAVFSGCLNVGQCYMKSEDVIVLQPSPYIQQYDQGFYIEPEVALSFYTEDNFAIGFNVSYEIITNQFNPYALALEQHNSYSASDLNGYTQNFSIGFHFVYTFWKKGKKK
jgi:hypothetical protein